MVLCITVSIRLFMAISIYLTLSLSLTHTCLYFPRKKIIYRSQYYSIRTVQRCACDCGRREGDENCDLLADQPLFTRPYTLLWRGSNEISLCVRPFAVPAGCKGFIRSYVLACPRTASSAVATTMVRTAWGLCPPPRLIPPKLAAVQKTRLPSVTYLFHNALHNRN